MISINPLDWRSVLLARHAQHVVLVHFPIGLFLMGVAFDLWGIVRKREEFVRVAYFNFCAAAILAVPTLLTGVAARQWALEGQKLKGILLFHFLLGTFSAIFMWVTWWLARAGDAERKSVQVPWTRLVVELSGAALLMLTGHLGGFLSGVNGGS